MTFLQEFNVTFVKSLPLLINYIYQFVFKTVVVNNIYNKIILIVEAFLQQYTTVVEIQYFL